MHQVGNLTIYTIGVRLSYNWAERSCLFFFVYEAMLKHGLTWLPKSTIDMSDDIVLAFTTVLAETKPRKKSQGCIKLMYTEHFISVMVFSEDVISPNNVSSIWCSIFFLSDELAGNACDLSKIGIAMLKSLETHRGSAHKESVISLTLSESQIQTRRITKTAAKNKTKSSKNTLLTLST